MKRNSLLVSLFLLLLLLGACSDKVSSTDTTTEATLPIYTSIHPLEDFTKKIGDPYVSVKTLIPPGADSHTYEPTSREILDIASADAFIYNGLGMETYAETIHETLKDENVMMVIASNGMEAIDNEHNHSHDHESEEDNGDDEEHHENEHDGHNHGDEDPHVWLDPHRAIVLAENIKDTLVALKPEAKEEFEQNFASLKDELTRLDEQFHQLVEKKNNPEMIVSHAAYGYWEEVYGIKQIPIAGLSSSQEPSQSELTQIIQLAREKNINYVIFEQNVTPKVAEVIREEINAEPLYLHNISTLTMEDIENEEDYFSLMKKNLETLDKALK